LPRPRLVQARVYQHLLALARKNQERRRPAPAFFAETRSALYPDESTMPYRHHEILKMATGSL
jgi:hypothetical protein